MATKKGGHTTIRVHLTIDYRIHFLIRHPQHSYGLASGKHCQKVSRLAFDQCNETRNRLLERFYRTSGHSWRIGPESRKSLGLYRLQRWRCNTRYLDWNGSDYNLMMLALFNSNRDSTTFSMAEPWMMCSTSLIQHFSLGSLLPKTLHGRVAIQVTRQIFWGEGLDNYIIFAD